MDNIAEMDEEEKVTQTEHLEKNHSHTTESPAHADIVTLEITNENLPTYTTSNEEFENKLSPTKECSISSPQADLKNVNVATDVTQNDQFKNKLSRTKESSSSRSEADVINKTISTDVTRNEQFKNKLSPRKESSSSSSNADTENKTIATDVTRNEQFENRLPPKKESSNSNSSFTSSSSSSSSSKAELKNENVATDVTRNVQFKRRSFSSSSSNSSSEANKAEAIDVTRNELVENKLTHREERPRSNSDSPLDSKEDVHHQSHDPVHTATEANTNTSKGNFSKQKTSTKKEPADLILETGLVNNPENTKSHVADVSNNSERDVLVSGAQVIKESSTHENKVEQSDSVSPPLVAIKAEGTLNKTRSAEKNTNQEKLLFLNKQNIETNTFKEETKVNDETSDAIVEPSFGLLRDSQNDNTQSRVISEDQNATQQDDRASVGDQDETAEYAELSANIENKQSNHTEESTELKLGQSHSMYFTGRLPTLDVAGRVTPNNEATGHGSNKEAGPYCETYQDGKIQTNEREKNDNSNILDKAVDDDETTDSGEIDKTTKEDNKRLSTPSREIQKIIQEINAPAQMYRLSKEKPLTPRDKQKANAERSDLSEHEEETDCLESKESKFQNLTINDLNVVTSEIMIEDSEKQSAAKYDDLPHMKKIIEYTVDNQLRDPEQNDTAHHSEHVIETAKLTRTVTEISEDTRIKEKNSSAQEDDTASANTEIEETALANQQCRTAHDDNGNKTSHSESDLKEIIASAKRARGDDDTFTENVTQSEATSILQASTQGTWRTDEASAGSMHDGLICSRCLRLDSDFTSSGFCYDCQEYLCGQCRKLHKESPATMFHYIMDSYCTNELKVKKYIRATSYCKDCEQFLCGKCTVQHSGFRSFRHHNIIQSSFFSRQAPSKVSSASSQSVSLDETDNTDDSETLRSDTNDMKKRKHKQYVFEKQANNPYGFKFNAVSESLYPGKNKKIAVSYTSSPKWPISSIPALPYLVKPGNLNQKTLIPPYFTAHKTPLYAKTKKGRATNSLKLKALQARYNVEPERKNFRRKEAALYMARPLKSTEGVSLPDISNIQSYTDGGQSSTNVEKVERFKPLQPSNKLKKAEFVREECLSIPFPSDELPCLIGGMEVLFDGRLVVLDKRNNNIKLFSRQFNCKASLQFQNRIVEICTSSIYPTDVYLATPKHIYEVSVKKGMEIARKMKVEITRIEGLRCWKYGIAVIFMKSDLSWEIRLLDFRGNLKSKLEILNPFTCEIEKTNRYHVTDSKGGKYLTISDNKNACAICVDVTTRCVVSETMMGENKKPGFLTSDYQSNVYVSCGDEVQQVSAKGHNLGVVVRLEKEKTGRVGCIAYNTSNDRMYVQIRSDVIAVYKMAV